MKDFNQYLNSRALFLYLQRTVRRRSEETPHGFAVEPGCAEAVLRVRGLYVVRCAPLDLQGSAAAPGRLLLPAGGGTGSQEAPGGHSAQQRYQDGRQVVCWIRLQQEEPRQHEHCHCK